MPEDPERTKNLNPHFTGFLGLYLHIPLYFVLAGIICSSVVVVVVVVNLLT